MHERSNRPCALGVVLVTNGVLTFEDLRVPIHQRLDPNVTRLATRAQADHDAFGGVAGRPPR